MANTSEKLTALQIARDVCIRKLEKIENNMPCRQDETVEVWNVSGGPDRLEKAIKNRQFWQKYLDAIDKELEDIVENEYRAL